MWWIMKVIYLCFSKKKKKKGLSVYHYLCYMIEYHTHLFKWHFKKVNNLIFSALERLTKTSWKLSRQTVHSIKFVMKILDTIASKYY